MSSPPKLQASFLNGTALTVPIPALSSPTQSKKSVTDEKVNALKKNGLVKVPSIEQIAFSKIDVAKFQQQLAKHTNEGLAKAKEILEKEVKELANNDSICLFTTGSDARGEKARSSSPIELIVAVDELNEKNRAIVEKIQKVVENNKLFDNILEVQSLANTNGEILVCPITNKFIPTRPMDARVVTGSSTIAQRYTKLFLDAVKKTNKEEITKFRRSCCNQARTQLENSLKGSLKEHFNIETGEIFYDGDKIKGTKYCHLRTMQYLLASEILKRYRANGFTEEEYANFPKNTVDRLEWFKSRKILLLTDTEYKDLVQAYLKAMEWFHQLQAKFEAEGKPCSLKVSKIELESVTKTILNFSRKENILKKVPKKKG